MTMSYIGFLQELDPVDTAVALGYEHRRG